MHEKSKIADRSFDFSVRIIELCRFIDKLSGIDRVLAKQLLRSGTSIGANVAEAQAAQSKADFIAKMSIASKESRETLYWLRLIQSSELTEAGKLTPIIQETTELVAIITSIVKTATHNK
ncbi:MAG: four helix bundle protein [Verrucomicrobiae bacterium]|nr:four helix bundle protein [Verrucomicrobiae bacterium]NNJ85924.1 four helix bundle protein [Akkermansiaceae bacterium]